MRRRPYMLIESALAMVLSWIYSAELGAAESGVVASIKPVHSLAAGVMQGVGEPLLLIEGASSPHSYSLRPSEALAISQARVVLWIGEGLETSLAKSFEALSATALVVALSEAKGVHLLPARPGGLWQEPEDEPQSPQDDGEGQRHAQPANDGDARREDHAQEHGRVDLHVWLDPHNAVAMVEAIVAALSQADPANASTYRENGDQLGQRLQLLDETLKVELAAVADRPFVVFHDAYQYFEKRYGLNALGAIAVDPGRRPGARRLAAIRDRLVELNAACVFAEPQFEPALVETVIEGTRARKGVLDPLGADLAPGPDHYFQLMTGLADSLVECLGPAE